MTGDFDLLGNPIAENRVNRGRSPHTRTEKNSNKIRNLLMLGRTNTGRHPGDQEHRGDAAEALNCRAVPSGRSAIAVPRDSGCLLR